MTPAAQSRRARRAAAMRLARELGDRAFDPRENLVRVSREDIPTARGCLVAHTSLDYAIALLETRGKLARARRIVRRILSLQVRDPRQCGYGNFPFFAHWDQVHDPNAVCFLTPNLVYIRTRHAARLGPDLCRRLDAAWPLCAYALGRHVVTRDYSNIFLLSLASKFLLAPLHPHSDLDEEARGLWQAWLRHTSRYGLVEYNSPTYLPVCLYALERLWTFGPRDLRAQFGRALEYLYFELAARYHAPSGLLAGAMSRAYPNDLLPGRSHAALAAHRQWGTPCAPDSPIIVNWLLSGYVAPTAIRRIALRKRLPLAIRADVEHLGISRTDHLARDFTLGSQTGRPCHIQEMAVLATVRSAAAALAVVCEPSFRQAARLMSCQRAATVLGIYTYDPVTVRYYYLGRNVRPAGALPAALAFEWRLGARDQVREVRANGVKWDGRALAMEGEAAVAVDYGRASLGLRVTNRSDNPRERPAPMRLEWGDGGLALRVPVAEAATVAQGGEAGAMVFYLRLAGGSGAACRRMADHLRRVAMQRAGTRAGAAWTASGAEGRLQVTSPATPVVHDSPLARIGPDDLLDFFVGRAPAPWA